MSQLFERKPIAQLVEDTESAHGLKRSLGAGDLIMLAIGAVIGAGIFGAIGTAAAGQIGPNNEVIRMGAGPAPFLITSPFGASCPAAAVPIAPKIPAPITAPIASMIRSPAPSVRFKLCAPVASSTSAAIGFR